MEISQGRGKLYRIGSEQFMGAINYRVYEDLTDEMSRWWGELTFVEYMVVQDNDGYKVELEDGRKGWCYLRKLVNRVVRGVPPHYVYRFTGTSPLE